MKKLFVSIILCLIFLTGCANENSLIIPGDTSQIKMESGHSNESTQEKNEIFYEDELIEYEVKNLCDYFDPDNFCSIDHHFYSVADLEHYILTCSQDLSEYSREPDPPFKNFTQIMSIDGQDIAKKLLKNGYCSINQILGVDADKDVRFDYAIFKITCGCEGVEYEFRTEDICFACEFVPNYFMERTTSDYYKEFLEHRSHTSPTEVYDLVKIGETDVIIKTSNGNKCVARMLVDGYLVTIAIINGMDDTVNQRVMASSNRYPMVNIFSNDESKAIDVIEKIENTLKTKKYAKVK